MSDMYHSSNAPRQPLVSGLENHKHKDPIPRAALRAMLALVVVVTAGVSLAVYSGVEPTARPPVMDIEAARAVMITPRLDGGLDVADASTGALIKSYPENDAGFLLGAHRAYTFERKRNGFAPDAAPLEFVRWVNGHMSILDPSTGWRADLHAFGSAHQANLETILEAAG